MRDSRASKRRFARGDGDRRRRLSPRARRRISGMAGRAPRVSAGAARVVAHGSPISSRECFRRRDASSRRPRISVSDLLDRSAQVRRRHRELSPALRRLPAGDHRRARRALARGGLQPRRGAGDAAISSCSRTTTSSSSRPISRRGSSRISIATTASASPAHRGSRDRIGGTPASATSTATSCTRRRPDRAGVLLMASGFQAPVCEDIRGLDGVFIAVRRHVWESAPLRRRYATTASISTISISRGGRAARARGSPCRSISLLLHRSTGRYDAAWRRYARRFVAQAGLDPLAPPLPGGLQARLDTSEQVDALRAAMLHFRYGRGSPVTATIGPAR